MFRKALASKDVAHLLAFPSICVNLALLVIHIPHTERKCLYEASYGPITGNSCSRKANMLLQIYGFSLRIQSYCTASKQSGQVSAITYLLSKSWPLQGDCQQLDCY